MWLLYQVVVGLAFALLGPLLWWKRRRHYDTNLLGQRLGGGAQPATRQALWLHAISVGEVAVAATLARALPVAVPLLVTTVTPTGQARARALLGKRAEVAYLPFDLGFAVNRFFRRHQPAALVLIEGDYWPLVLRRASHLGIPVAVVNGRVSDRAFPRLHRLRKWLGPIFGPIGRFAVQTEADRDRLLALNVPAQRITVTGNLKFDSPTPQLRAELAALVLRLAAGRPIWVAGSTMCVEEEGALLDAWASSGKIPGERHFLIVAPRHPERWDEVWNLMCERGIDAARRSQSEATPSCAVLLLDTLGELAGLYSLAQAAFIGGTLVATGGHNPLEPAAFAVPILAGPHMENFRDIAETFDARGAWRRVADASELASTVAEWLSHPAAARLLGERGREALNAHRGTTERTLAFLAPILGRFQIPAESVAATGPGTP
jgi:3-deoxy-D-manno-octulosonic-acid transferase